MFVVTAHCRVRSGTAKPGDGHQLISREGDPCCTSSVLVDHRSMGCGRHRAATQMLLYAGDRFIEWSLNQSPAPHPRPRWASTSDNLLPELARLLVGLTCSTLPRRSAARDREQVWRHRRDRAVISLVRSSMLAVRSRVRPTSLRAGRAIGSRIADTSRDLLQNGDAVRDRAVRSHDGSSSARNYRSRQITRALSPTRDPRWSVRSRASRSVPSSPRGEIVLVVGGPGDSEGVDRI